MLVIMGRGTVRSYDLRTRHSDCTGLCSVCLRVQWYMREKKLLTFSMYKLNIKWWDEFELNIDLDGTRCK